LTQNRVGFIDMTQQFANKPTAAFALSLVAGILGILAGVLLILVGLVFASIVGVSFYYGYTPILMIYAGIGVWELVVGAIVLAGAAKIHSSPADHRKWGIIVLIFSCLGGNIFGIIGGALALAWHPMPYAPAPPPYGAPYAQAPTQVITRICPQCGRVVPENIKFCPNCGKEMI
jgi:hypothetical protein